MTPKFFVLLGLTSIAIGCLMYINQKFGLGLGNLPGDINIKKDNLRVYIPIVSCLLISALLSAIFWLWNYFR